MNHPLVAGGPVIYREQPVNLRGREGNNEGGPEQYQGAGRETDGTR